MPGTGDSQAYDRFAYSSNNPIKYIDPTGHRNCEEDGYCPDNSVPDPAMTVAKATEDYSYTSVYNNTASTSSSPSSRSLPQYHPVSSGSYTGFTTVGIPQVNVDISSYDTTDSRYRLPGIDVDFPNPFDVINYLAEPYANSALMYSVNPNLSVTINYNISLGESYSFAVSNVILNNPQQFPITLNKISMYSDLQDERSLQIGQFTSSNYANYSSNISVNSFQYADVRVSLYSSYDNNDMFSGFRFINTRLWSNGFAEAK